MSSSELMHKALELSSEDRAELARQLILSLEPEAPDAAADEAWGAEIERRLSAVDSGAAKMIDWRDSVERARESLRRDDAK